MRLEVDRLLDAADKTSDTAERRALTFHALELAQKAEATERALKRKSENGAAMRLYRVYFCDAAGTFVGTELIRSVTDEDAKNAALALIEGRSEIRRLEAWRQAKLAFRLSTCDLHKTA